LCACVVCFFLLILACLISFFVSFGYLLDIIFYFFQGSWFYLFIFFQILFYLTLQYCIGFAIYQNESVTGIHVFPILNPPPSPYHPSGSSQCTSPKHPVLCIQPGLATRFIYYTYFNAILPNHPTLSLSHRVQKTVPYISVSFAVLYNRVIVTIFLNSIYMR